MRKTFIALAVFSLILGGGCRRESTSTSDAAQPGRSASATHDMTPEQLGELGAQIRKQPERADEILSQHGMNRETFEQAIRKVTESPEASKRYAVAYRKASA